MAINNEYLCFDFRCVGDCTGNATLFQCATGLCVDLLNKLKEDMQFDYEMMQARDNQWGNYIDDSVSLITSISPVKVLILVF